MDLDLLVLGGGPAGFAISSLMAKKGYSVEILDSAFFPRAKICGEFLNPQSVEWLQQENLLTPLLNLNPFPIHGMKITDRNGDSFTGHYANHGSASGYAIMRKEFDTLLVHKAREAGIKIHEGFKAQALLMDGDRAIGVRGVTSKGEPFEKTATILVGADGRNNLIGRTFGWMRNLRQLRKYAFMTYFQNVPELSNVGEMHLVQDGYIGIAPLTATLANVALVVDEKACPRWDGDLIRFFFSHLNNSPLQSRFEGLQPIAPLISAGPLAFEVTHASGHGTVLVGDTCGFIDPFTGEGINYAFVSARIAAEVLDRAFRSKTFADEALRTYDVERQKVLGTKFQIAKLLQKAIAWPQISTLLIKRFGQNASLGDMIVSAVGSAIPAEQIWNLRFALRVALGV